MNKPPYEILMIEDNPGDVMLLQEVFTEADFDCRFKNFAYGENALGHLEAIKDPALLPDLILLDINLPGDNGLTILKKLKSDAHTLSIPVIVLSSSEAQADISASYQNYGNAFINKPIDLDEYIERIQSLKKFWLITVALPGQKHFSTT